MPCPTQSLKREARSVAYSPDGAEVAVHYTDQKLRIWDAEESGKLRQSFETDVQFFVDSLRYSQDGESIIGGGNISDVTWCANTGAVLALSEPRPIVSGCGSRPRNAVSLDGVLEAVTNASDVEIEIRERETGTVRYTLVDPSFGDWVVAMTFSPDGRLLASGYLGYAACLWDLDTGKQRQFFWTRVDSIASIAFSADCRRLAIGGSYDPAVVLCDLEKESQPVRVVFPASDYEHLEGIIEAHQFERDWIPSTREVTLDSNNCKSLRGVCFSPDGQRVASVAMDGALRIWEAASGDLLLTIFPPDGGLLES